MRRVLRGVLRAVRIFIIPKHSRTKQLRPVTNPGIGRRDFHCGHHAGLEEGNGSVDFGGLLHTDTSLVHTLGQRTRRHDLANESFLNEQTQHSDDVMLAKRNRECLYEVNKLRVT